MSHVLSQSGRPLPADARLNRARAVLRELFSIYRSQEKPNFRKIHESYFVIDGKEQIDANTVRRWLRTIDAGKEIASFRTSGLEAVEKASGILNAGSVIAPVHLPGPVVGGQCDNNCALFNNVIALTMSEAEQAGARANTIASAGQYEIWMAPTNRNRPLKLIADLLLCPHCKAGKFRANPDPTYDNGQSDRPPLPNEGFFLRIGVNMHIHLMDSNCHVSFALKYPGYPGKRPYVGVILDPYPRVGDVAAAKVVMLLRSSNISSFGDTSHATETEVAKALNEKLIKKMLHAKDTRRRGVIIVEAQWPEDEEGHPRKKRLKSGNTSHSKRRSVKS